MSEESCKGAEDHDSGRSRLRIIGEPGSHDAIRKMLRDRTPCKVLDAPAGEGILSSFLLELGWDVHSADIDQGHFRLRGVPFQEANLNRGLPYDDESFDAVTCINGLHRLYNPGGAIREFYRILKPGGHLYVNFNNYAAIDRRLRFFLCGSMDTGVNEGCCSQTTENPEAHVRIYLLFPQVANALDAAGFKILDVKRSAIWPRHRILLPLAWVIRPLTLFVPPDRRKRDHIKWTASSAILPGGRYVLIDSMKSG